MPSNAELERRVIAVERKLDEILTELQSRPLPQRVAEPFPSYPHPHHEPPPNYSVSGCSCPPNTVCGNVACPRAPKITCVTPPGPGSGSYGASSNQAAAWASYGFLR